MATIYSEMVMEALRTRAPSLFQQLQASGELEAFVAAKGEEIHEAVGMVRSDLMRQSRVLYKTDYLEKVQLMTEIDNRARELVLNDLLEFPTDDDEESSRGQAGAITCGTRPHATRAFRSC